MVDISNAKQNICAQERYFHKWLEANGFDAVLVKQHKDDTVYDITRDGHTQRTFFPMSVRVNKREVCAVILKNFEDSKKLADWEKAHEE